MPTPADEITFVRLLESLDSIHTGAQLSQWVSTDLQVYFPHGAFICGLGRIHQDRLAPVKLIASNFPVEYLRLLKQPDGLFASSVIKNWLACGEVQLVEGRSLKDKNLDSAWLARFQVSGLQNVAAHGVKDFSNRYASYFSFHQIPPPLGEIHRYRLKMLVPHLHIVLLRIMQKLKAEKRARTDKTLTARELEVLTWVGDGKTSAEIAVILGSSPNTVRNQIQSTLIKLRVNTRTQAVAKAIKKGLVVNRQPDSEFGGF